jgi:hypothetical protein
MRPKFLSSLVAAVVAGQQARDTAAAVVVLAVCSKFHPHSHHLRHTASPSVQVVQVVRLETTTVRLAAIQPHLVLHQQAVGLEVETTLLRERAEAAVETAVAAMLRLRLAHQAKATPAVGATQANQVSYMAAVAAARLRLAQIGTQAAPRLTAARELRCLEPPTRAAVAAEMSVQAH